MQSVQGIAVSYLFEIITSICLGGVIQLRLLACLDCRTVDAKVLVPAKVSGNVFEIKADHDEVSTQVDESESDLSAASEAEDCDSLPQDKSFSTSVLFDHYGLFGASPGSWLQNSWLEEEADNNVDDGGGDDDDDDDDDPVPPNTTMIDLLEHYSLFDANPGVWSGRFLDMHLEHDDRHEKSGSNVSHQVHQCVKTTF